MEFIESVQQELRDSVERWWERACGQSDFAASYRALSEIHRAQLPRVIAASEFVAQALIRDPQALAWFARLDACEPGSADADYEIRAASAASVEQALSLLREWRRRAMVRIAWRDIAGTAAVAETLQAVSDLADAAIRAATAAAELNLLPTFGNPYRSNPARAPFIILGMGKLGGRELNFSSDIDLVFLFTEAGETSGPRVTDNEEYFNRLGREIIRLLDARNADGFVFRGPSVKAVLWSSAWLRSRIICSSTAAIGSATHGSRRAPSSGPTPMRRLTKNSCVPSSTAGTWTSAYSNPCAA
jgi:glutamine synthetase adenylyltransferase